MSLEFTLRGTAVDYAVMVYAGAVYKRIPNISLEGVIGEMMKSGMLGIRKVYRKPGIKEDKLYSLQQLLTVAYDTIIEYAESNIENGWEAEHALIPVFEAFELFHEKEGIHAEDLKRAFTNEEVACYACEPTYSRWKELMKAIQC